MKTMPQRTLIALAMLVTITLIGGCTLYIDPIISQTDERMNKMNTSAPTQSGYVTVNGLEMYYEIHGTGQPLVLLHGGLTTIDASFGTVIPTLAERWQVIAVEQQGHGHTADIDRPLTFEQMADDTAALLQHLKVEKADFFGYSDGGNVALGIAIRHPQLVRKLAVAGTNFNNEGLYPEILAFFEHVTPELYLCRF